MTSPIISAETGDELEVLTDLADSDYILVERGGLIARLPASTVNSIDTAVQAAAAEDSAAAAEAAVSALQGSITKRFGATNALHSGTAITANYTLVDTATAIPGDGPLTGLEVYASGNGTLVLRRFVRSGSGPYTYTRAGSDLTLTVSGLSAAGIATFTAPDLSALVFNAGEFVGYYMAASGSCLPHYAAILPGDDAEGQLAGNQTVLVNPMAPTVRTQINFTQTYTGLVVTAETNTIAREAGAGVDLLDNPGEAQIVGRAEAPVDGTISTSSNQFIWDAQILAPGILKSLTFWAKATGTATVRNWRYSGSTLVAASSFTVSIAATGLVELSVANGDFADFPVLAGDFLSISGGQVAYTIVAKNDNGGFWQTAIANTAFTPGSPIVTTLIQCGFDLEYTSQVVTGIGMTDLRSRVAILEQDGSPILNAACLPWLGKVISMAGDSITYNNQYPPVVLDQTGASRHRFASDAVAGRQMADLTAYLTGGNLAGVDAMSVFLGTNDFYSSRALGAHGDAIGANTFFGDTRSVIEAALTARPAMRLLFMTPMKRGSYSGNAGWNTANGVGQTLTAYVDAIIAVCGDYSIPVLDLFRTSGLNDLTFASLTADNLHPNDGFGGGSLAHQIASFFNRN